MVSLAAFVVITSVVAFAANRYRPDAWFRSLAKPRWNPPDWLFAPMWTVLYIGIAVAGWLAWRSTKGWWSMPLTLWAIQLVANGMWTWLFFGRHRIRAALIDICVVLVAIVAFIVGTYHDTPEAALLFVPYLVWIAFATVLNAVIWTRNQGRTRNRGRRGNRARIGNPAPTRNPIPTGHRPGVRAHR